MIFARRILAEAGIESHHLQHLDRLQIQLRSNPINAFGRDEAEFVLNDVKQWQDGRAFAFRVMGDALVSLGIEFRANDKRWKELFASGFMRGDQISEGGR